MIVLSRSDNYGRRNVLRKTWMNKRNSELIREGTMKALFLVGMNPGDLKMKKMILEEARLYGDLIVADLNDSYDQLSYKTLTLLLFATRKAPQFGLIGKIDEDVVFFPDQLTPLIENKLIKVNTSSMYGYLVGEGLEVNHIHHGKWFIPMSAYSCLKYPGYLSGPFYLTTKLAAEKIITATKHRNFLSVEDVFFTGLIANDVGITRTHLPNTHLYLDLIVKDDDVILARHTKMDNDEYLKYFRRKSAEQRLLNIFNTFEVST
ncbi:unnamed protein product [Caenorhabditis brenneri]